MTLPSAVGHVCDLSSLSLIYYPAAAKVTIGHVELEVDGTSWNLVPLCKSKTPSRDLSRMIQYAKSGKGYPFFRIHIMADDMQIRALRDLFKSQKGRSIFCTQAALKPLSDLKVCHVPFLFRISPFFSTIYLVFAKQLGARHILNIEFCGSDNKVIDIARSVLGLLAELNLFNFATTSLNCLFFGGKSIDIVFSLIQIKLF
jgi:hypothetical protein